MHRVERPPHRTREQQLDGLAKRMNLPRSELDRYLRIEQRKRMGYWLTGTDTRTLRRVRRH